MSNQIRDILDSYLVKLKSIYGDHLNQVILYGSYARGDNTQESDIDIMLLVDLSAMDIKTYGNSLSDLTFDYLMDYNVDISPIVVNSNHFNKWVDNYSFYNNVNREGVILYNAA